MTIKQKARRLIFQRLNVSKQVGNEVFDEIGALTNDEVEASYASLKTREETRINANIAEQQAQLGDL